MNSRYLIILKRYRAIVLVLAGLLVIAPGCTEAELNPDLSRKDEAATGEIPLARGLPERLLNEDSRFVEARRRMVAEQLRRRDVTDPKVLEAMGRVPRQCFVPKELLGEAYTDSALPIEKRQTISQPYIVALMTQIAQPTPKSRALEIGTGSGYQAAVLAELCKHVYSIEIHESLADTAKKRLDELGYKNITVRHGDGYQGWKEHAPFDLILVTAAPDHVPKALVEQLAVGGRMVIPVGGYYQELLLLEKQQDGSVRRRSIAPVLFVPMTGEAQE